jgi:hypothetical protein
VKYLGKQLYFASPEMEVVDWTGANQITEEDDQACEAMISTQGPGLVDSLLNLAVT